MKQVPKLPRDWKKWVMTNGITEHYMFYRYKKGDANEGYCTHCQKMVPIQNPKYNAKGSCCKCGQEIRYKSVGKFKRIITKMATVQILQQCSSGLILRKFGAQVFYDQEDYQKPSVFYREETRIFYDKEWNPERYYFGRYKLRDNRWIAGKKPIGYFYYSRNESTYGRTYEKNLILNELKNTGLLEALKLIEINPDYYLERLKKIPILEKIVKADLNHLAKDVILDEESFYFNSDSSLTQALGIDKAQLKRLRKINGGVLVLNWFQYEKKNKRNIPDDVIEWLDKMNFYPEDLSFILDRMSLVQIKNYLLRQAEQNEESVECTLTTWKDYLSMAIRCGHDVQDEIVYRTSKLFSRHQKLVDQLTQEERQKRVKAIMTQYPNVQQILLEIKEKYAYQDKKYAVIVPESIEDIWREGKCLHHCVASSNDYFARIQSKETYILFLRKIQNISTPYYTMEVEPDGTVRQKQTGYGREKTDIQFIEDFLTKWQREVRRRIGKEEKKLAAASKLARKQELKMLREKRAMIHGGIYDGQMVADVLAADVMESPDAA